jgi:FkbM family methyltransferase
VRELIHRLKWAMAGAARRWGYRIERIMDLGDSRLDIFELTARDLMQRVPDLFFVQIGAHDGVDDDPIRTMVARYHWGGLLVEPQPDVFAHLVRNYESEPQLIFENAAIAARDGITTLYVPEEGPLQAAGTCLASLNEAVVRQRIGLKAPIRKIRVPALTLRSLLAKHHIARVDLLQIDAEGYDFELIKMLDDAGIDLPPLVHFEHANLSRSVRQDCFEHLASRHYRLARDEIDAIAYRPAGW